MVKIGIIKETKTPVDNRVALTPREILTIQEKYPNAVLLLRSMTPFFNDGNREPYRQSYMDVISKLANEYDTIYIDQYTSLKEEDARFLYEKTTNKIFY